MKLVSTLLLASSFGFLSQGPQATAERRTDFRVVLLGTGSPNPRADRFGPRTRTTYQGPLEIGEDLLAISIGESVAVQRIR